MHVYSHKQKKKKQRYNDFLLEARFWETFVSLFILHCSSQSVSLLLLSISILFIFQSSKVCNIYWALLWSHGLRSGLILFSSTRDKPRSYPHQANALALRVGPPPLCETSHHRPHVQVVLIDFPKKLSGSWPEVTESKRDELWILIRQPCPRVHLWATNSGSTQQTAASAWFFKRLLNLFTQIVCFVFRDRVSRFPDGTQMFYVAEDRLKLFLIALLLPPKGWDDKVAPPRLFYMVLGSECRALCVSELSTNWAIAPTHC